MAGWIGYLHRRSRHVKNKLFTLLWYRYLFHRMGARCIINSPIYTYRPDAIEIGNRVSIGPSCRLEAYPDDPLSSGQVPMLKIGNRVRLEHRVQLSCLHSLIIEEEALIASGCYISDNNHSIDPTGPPYMDQPSTFAPTLIGRGVWIGQNVCVLAGSVIGERSVIGAGSVVKGYIPPYSIAVGAPARVVKRYCFDTNQWIKVENRETVSV